MPPRRSFPCVSAREADPGPRYSNHPATAPMTAIVIPQMSVTAATLPRHYENFVTYPTASEDMSPAGATPTTGRAHQPAPSRTRVDKRRRRSYPAISRFTDEATGASSGRPGRRRAGAGCRLSAPYGGVCDCSAPSWSSRAPSRQGRGRQPPRTRPPQHRRRRTIGRPLNRSTSCPTPSPPRSSPRTPD